jgi:hypothetical protein
VEARRLMGGRDRSSRLALLGAAAWLLLGGCATTSWHPIPHGACAGSVPNGPYTWLSLEGKPEIEGSFDHGRKDGVFTFYGGAGDELAQIPFHEDAIQGTIRLWYSRMSTGGVAGRRKLLASYSAGEPDGDKVSWYADGSRRAIFHYTRGRLDHAQVWSPDGAPGAQEDATAMAAQDLAADARYYQTLEGFVAEAMPTCP